MTAGGPKGTIGGSAPTSVVNTNFVTNIKGMGGLEPDTLEIAPGTPLDYYPPPRQKNVNGVRSFGVVESKVD